MGCYHQPQTFMLCPAVGNVYTSEYLGGTYERIDRKVLYKKELLFLDKSRETFITLRERAEHCKEGYTTKPRETGTSLPKNSSSHLSIKYECISLTMCLVQFLELEILERRKQTQIFTLVEPGEGDR